MLLVCTQQSRLFYVTDHNSSLGFLVDTGAEASAVPPSRAKQNHRQGSPGLQGVSGIYAIATDGNA